MDYTTLSSDNQFRFRKKLLQKMTVDANIKAVDNKIKESKAQKDLDWQTAKMFALSSGNVSKFLVNFWLVKLFYQKKTCLKETALKWYSNISKSLKIFSGYSFESWKHRPGLETNNIKD